MTSLKIIEIVQQHFPEATVNQVEHLYNKYINEICRELKFGVNSLAVTMLDGVYTMTDKIHRVRDIYIVNDDDTLTYTHWINPNRRISEDIKLLGNKLNVWWSVGRELFLGYPDADSLLQPTGTALGEDTTLSQSVMLYGKIGLPYQSFASITDVFAYADMVDEFDLPDIAILGILSDLYMLTPQGDQRSMFYEQRYDKEKYKLKKYLTQSKTKTYRAMIGVPSGSYNA